MANPVLALADLKNEVSNRFEETCACGGVKSKDAVVGILETLARVCGDAAVATNLEILARALKPVEEQPDVLGFDASGQSFPDLNQYAGTIRSVFSKLALVYDDGESGPVTDTVADIVSVLDADVCADIIKEASKVEETQ